jgi:AcrR family transcriptional regulator
VPEPSSDAPEERATEAEATPRGRPRDPDLEGRATRAALQIFAEKGWAGLTIDGVASQARVGKSALYLRWANKSELLAAALRHVQDEAQNLGPVEPAPPEDPTAGRRTGAGDTEPGTEPDPAEPEAEPAPLTLRDFLIRHATRRAELYLAENGLAMIRLYAEAHAHPELLADVREQALTAYVLEERERVAAAIRAGELAADASPVRILDAVEGAVFMHIIVTPPRLIGRVRAGIHDYVEKMVDDQLRAAGYVGATPGRPAEPSTVGPDQPSRKLTP